MTDFLLYFSSRLFLPHPFFTTLTPTLDLLFHFYSDIKPFPQSSVVMSDLGTMNTNKQLLPARSRNTSAIQLHLRRRITERTRELFYYNKKEAPDIK